MIYVDLKKFKPSTNWIKRAKAHTAILTKESNKSAYFRTQANVIWTELLNEWRIKYDKCWISESKNPGSNASIEHFRPKGDVSINDQVKKLKLKTAQRKNSIGYWWLAYNWENYRFSFPVPNTSKSIFFPLKHGSFIAKKPTDNHSREENFLIDPTVIEDVKLLTVEPSDGTIKPTYNIMSKNSLERWKSIRAIASISIYDLDNQFLVNARIEKVKECKKELESCLRNFNNALKFINDKVVSSEFLINSKESIDKLKDMMDDKSDFALTSRIAIYSILDTKEYLDIKPFF